MVLVSNTRHDNIKRMMNIDCWNIPGLLTNVAIYQ